MLQSNISFHRALIPADGMKPRANHKFNNISWMPKAISRLL